MNDISNSKYFQSFHDEFTPLCFYKSKHLALLLHHFGQLVFELSTVILIIINVLMSGQLYITECKSSNFLVQNLFLARINLLFGQPVYIV